MNSGHSTRPHCTGGRCGGQLLFGLIIAATLLTPMAAHAQEASITGVVRDASGAVLPGVTVEATSSALTEKVRTVVTDGTGQYRIVSLPVGTYTVTYTLPGFNVVKREAPPSPREVIVPSTATVGSILDHVRKPHAERVEIECNIASGGMGAIDAAVDRALDRRIAIKTLHRHLHSDDQSVRMFLREARLTGLLDHPHIVPVYDLGEREGGRLFFAMKLVEGQTLAAIIRSLPPGLPDTATLTILDDDFPTITVSPASVNEPDDGETAVMSFGLTLSEPAPYPITVRYSTVDGTAVAGGASPDYTAAANAERVIAAGQTSATIDIDVIGDLLIEGDETFQLAVSSFSPAGVVIAGSPVTGTIVDNDAVGISAQTQPAPFHSPSFGPFLELPARRGPNGILIPPRQFLLCRGSGNGVGLSRRNLGRIARRGVRRELQVHESFNRHGFRFARGKRHLKGALAKRDLRFVKAAQLQQRLGQVLVEWHICRRNAERFTQCGDCLVRRNHGCSPVIGVNYRNLNCPVSPCKRRFPADERLSMAGREARRSSRQRRRARDCVIDPARAAGANPEGMTLI